ncbi:MAG TPA: prenyltransferase/squalene oxidase repeat-containing protein [Bryobacteraceae bacterium]|nr:prenyltransferase/squalene oxidase repeat-containing protein [Bryobacteraceae bacterium]
MRSMNIRVLVTGAAAIAIGICAETSVSVNKPSSHDPVSIAVDKGMKWLVSVQGKDGGWGQDGGETSYVRQGERLESNGNDVANTAVAAEALLHAGNTPTTGPYHESLQHAVRFILEHVERSPVEGLAVTDLNGTQIQRKLGPYIDTFLTSKLLADLDGNMGNAQENARVRTSLQKCVAKVEKNQLKDGSWNIAGGWAPILGTSMASQSLFVANSKGVAVHKDAMDKVDTYTAQTVAPPAAVMAGSGGGVSIGVLGGVGGGRYAMSAELSASSAGVSLYKRAQELEQLSRTPEDRKKNGEQIKTIEAQLSDPRFVTGFGSIGGEEFFSYLNISDSLHRAGGPEWERWNRDMTAKILTMQNEDGTWAGHHCITGRVAVTSAAILMLQAGREK